MVKSSNEKKQRTEKMTEKVYITKNEDGENVMFTNREHCENYVRKILQAIHDEVGCKPVRDWQVKRSYIEVSKAMQKDIKKVFELSPVGW